MEGMEWGRAGHVLVLTGSCFCSLHVDSTTHSSTLQTLLFPFRGLSHDSPSLSSIGFLVLNFKPSPPSSTLLAIFFFVFFFYF
jgi:hypothetical protein